MSRRTRQHKKRTSGQQQPYDHLLKSLLEGHEKEVLPYFVPHVEYLETLDVEMHRSTLRGDRAYKVRYRQLPHILQIEFESGSDPEIDKRLLDYHTYLHRTYDLPVISIIVYPFRTTMASPPFREMSGDEEIVVFHYRVCPLWKLKAEEYLQEHAVLLYSLLPTMEGVTSDVLYRAIDEMVQYHQSNQEQLIQELRWMGIMLRRAEMLPIEETHQIEERLSMYDDLFERDPKMQKWGAERVARGRAQGIVEGRAKGLAEGIAKGEAKGIAKGEAKGIAKGEAKGIAEGIAKGKTEGLQEALLRVIEGRFPPLRTLAEQKVPQISTPELLTALVKGVAAAPDESTARLLLELLAA